MIKYIPVRIWRLYPSRLIHILYFSCGLFLVGEKFVPQLAGKWRLVAGGEVSVEAVYFVALIYVSRWSGALRYF